VHSMTTEIIKKMKTLAQSIQSTENALKAEIETKTEEMERLKAQRKRIRQDLFQRIMDTYLPEESRDETKIDWEDFLQFDDEVSVKEKNKLLETFCPSKDGISSLTIGNMAGYFPDTQQWCVQINLFPYDADNLIAVHHMLTCMIEHIRPIKLPWSYRSSFGESTYETAIKIKTSEGIYLLIRGNQVEITSFNSNAAFKICRSLMEALLELQKRADNDFE